MFSCHLGRWNKQRVRASQKWFRGRGLRVKIADGRGRGKERKPTCPPLFTFLSITFKMAAAINVPLTFREKTLALQAEKKSAVRFPSYIMLLSSLPTGWLWLKKNISNALLLSESCDLFWCVFYPVIFYLLTRDRNDGARGKRKNRRFLYVSFVNYPKYAKKTFYKRYQRNTDTFIINKAYEGYIVFKCTLFCLNSRPGSWDTPLCPRTVLQLKRNKVDVQSLGDCQLWTFFRLSCRVGYTTKSWTCKYLRFYAIYKNFMWKQQICRECQVIG